MSYQGVWFTLQISNYMPENNRNVIKLYFSQQKILSSVIFLTRETYFRSKKI